MSQIGTNHGMLFIIALFAIDSFTELRKNQMENAAFDFITSVALKEQFDVNRNHVEDENPINELTSHLKMEFKQSIDYLVDVLIKLDQKLFILKGIVGKNCLKTLKSLKLDPKIDVDATCHFIDQDFKGFKYLQTYAMNRYFWYSQLYELYKTVTQSAISAPGQPLDMTRGFRKRWTLVMRYLSEVIRHLLTKIILFNLEFTLDSVSEFTKYQYVDYMNAKDYFNTVYRQIKSFDDVKAKEVTSQIESFRIEFSKGYASLKAMVEGNMGMMVESWSKRSISFHILYTERQLDPLVKEAISNRQVEEQLFINSLDYHLIPLFASNSLYTSINTSIYYLNRLYSLLLYSKFKHVDQLDTNTQKLHSKLYKSGSDLSTDAQMSFIKHRHLNFKSYCRFPFYFYFEIAALLNELIVGFKMVYSTIDNADKLEDVLLLMEDTIVSWKAE